MRYNQSVFTLTSHAVYLLDYPSGLCIHHGTEDKRVTSRVFLASCMHTTKHWVQSPGAQVPLPWQHQGWFWHMRHPIGYTSIPNHQARSPIHNPVEELCTSTHVSCFIYLLVGAQRARDVTASAYVHMITGIIHNMIEKWSCHDLFPTFCKVTVPWVMLLPSYVSSCFLLKLMPPFYFPVQPTISNENRCGPHTVGEMIKQNLLSCATPPNH